MSLGTFTSKLARANSFKGRRSCLREFCGAFARMWVTGPTEMVDCEGAGRKGVQFVSGMNTQGKYIMIIFHVYENAPF